MRVNILIYVEAEVQDMEQASDITDKFVEQITNEVNVSPARIVAVNADDPEEADVPEDDTDIPF